MKSTSNWKSCFHVSFFIYIPWKNALIMRLSLYIWLEASEEESEPHLWCAKLRSWWENMDGNIYQVVGDLDWEFERKIDPKSLPCERAPDIQLRRWTSFSGASLLFPCPESQCSTSSESGGCLSHTNRMQVAHPKLPSPLQLYIKPVKMTPNTSYFWRPFLSFPFPPCTSFFSHSPFVFLYFSSLF